VVPRLYLKHLPIVRYTHKTHKFTVHPMHWNTPQEINTRATYEVLSDRHLRYPSLINTYTSIWLRLLSWYRYSLSPRYILPDYWFILWLEKRRYKEVRRETHAHECRVSNRTPDVAMLAPACPSVWTEGPRHTMRIYLQLHRHFVITYRTENRVSGIKTVYVTVYKIAFCT
jgi:hypothetical protein